MRAVAVAPRTGARSRRGARARADRRPCRPSLRDRRGRSRRRAPSRRAAGGRPPHAPGRRTRARSRARPRTASAHRVDHADSRTFALERGTNCLELGLGKHLDPLSAAEARGAELNLRRRLLAGDEQHPCGRRSSRAAPSVNQRRLDPAPARRRRALATRGRARRRGRGRAPARRSRYSLGLLCLDVDEASTAARPLKRRPLDRRATPQ